MMKSSIFYQGKKVTLSSDQGEIDWKICCHIIVVVILKDKHSSTYISIKIKTEFQHKHDVLHYGTNMHWWLHWKGSQEYIRESNQS